MSHLAIQRIDELVAFRSTAQEGSLSAAAKSLRIPVNQVSRRLAKLEERLGVVLIARTTRRSRLTSEGQLFLERTRRVLEELEAAELELLDGVGPTGVLRIAVPTVFTGKPMLDQLVSTLRAHPTLEIELLVRDVPLDPITDGCDASVVVGRPDAGRCQLIPLGEVAPVLVATRAYLARAGTPTEPAQLIDHQCLLFTDTERQTHWQLFDGEGTTHQVPVGGRFGSDNSRMLRDAMYAGLGIGVLPDRVMHERTDVVRVLPGYRMGPFDLYALCPPGARPSRRKLALSIIRRALDMSDP